MFFQSYLTFNDVLNVSRNIFFSETFQSDVRLTLFKCY